MDALLDRYGALLGEVDDWFRRCINIYPDLIACRNGCSECCRGLFDITLLDAFYLKRGFVRLPEPLKAGLSLSATKRLQSLSLINPEFADPWLLNGIAEENWDALMPEDDETPCLLLSETGECLLYDYRPMTCRLNGIPMVDNSGEELFDEWCTLNFKDAEIVQLSPLRFGFTDLFGRELLLFREFVKCLTGVVRNEVDLFVPAAAVMGRDKIVTAIKLLDSQSAATTKLPGNPLRSNNS